MIRIGCPKVCGGKPGSCGSVRAAAGARSGADEPDAGPEYPIAAGIVALVLGVADSAALGEKQGQG